MNCQSVDICHKDCKKCRAAMRKERIRIKKKKICTVCSITGIASFLYMLGIVGGMENGSITTKQFIINAVASLVVLYLSIVIGNKQ